MSILSGTTVADQNTTIIGSLVVVLRTPIGITVYGVEENESLFTTDINAKQFVHIKNVNSNNRNISAIGRNSTDETGFVSPFSSFVDIEHVNNLYVSDYNGNFVVLFTSNRMTNPLPLIVAGMAVDRNKNLYIADFRNPRITRWPPNAPAGAVIAGTSIAGSDSRALNGPVDIFLDASNSSLYVIDVWNSRIQMFRLNGTPPYNGTTVAGGNGVGSGSHQLNMPNGIWVSKTTGAIYIADEGNHRIQRWSRGASSGVTVAGSPSGRSGSDATRFNSPHELFVNSEETCIYVTDGLNRRVQRFDLI